MVKARVERGGEERDGMRFFKRILNMCFMYFLLFFFRKRKLENRKLFFSIKQFYVFYVESYVRL